MNIHFAPLQGYTDDAIDGLEERFAAVEGGVAGVDGKITAAFNKFMTDVSNDEVVNTYKELIDYAAEHGSEFTTLVGVVANKAEKEYVDNLDKAMDARVADLEKIDHDAYIAADEAVLSAANGAAQGYAATAKSEAIETAAGDATTKANTAYNNAIAEAARLDAIVLQGAKDYADGLVKVDGQDRFDSKGSAAQALVDAKAYTDERETAIDGKWAAADVVVLGEAKTYAKNYADGLAGNYDAAGTAQSKADAAQAAAIAQAKADAAEALKAYYTSSQIDAKLSENSTGDRAYAKQYTDELFNSFKFAETGDIDGLFA